MSEAAVPGELPQARERFLALVADVRPELHRYCARMTGSIVDGEDIVQDTLAKAFYALAMSAELPPLRPWLFRVAHNAAIDWLRRHDRARVELVAETPEPEHATHVDDTGDPEALRTALALFLALPPLQRSAVIMKDVLDCSLAEIASTLETTVPAVKSALVRGRARLREERRTSPAGQAVAARDPADAELEALERYVRLFNAGDWDGLRSLLAEEVVLDLVSKSARRGKAVGLYFTQYAKDPDVRLELGGLDGRPVLWAYAPKTSATPAYAIELTVDRGRVTSIRDYRYVPYFARDLALDVSASFG